MTPLEETIIHWQKNVDAETPFRASAHISDCALCSEHYYSNFNCGRCNNCPVAEKTGYSNCRETPYGKAYYALNRWCLDPTAKDAWQKAAQAELDFLKSLLPENDDDK